MAIIEGFRISGFLSKVMSKFSSHLNLLKASGNISIKSIGLRLFAFCALGSSVKIKVILLVLIPQNSYIDHENKEYGFKEHL